MIDRILRKNGKTLKDFIELPILDGSIGLEFESLIENELDHNKTLLVEEFNYD